MSLLQQLRPTPWELEKRRWGPRKYDPNYNLYQHLRPLTVAEARETRPIKHPNPVHVTESGERWYPSKNGWLNRDLMEKFSADLAYKSEVMREYVQYVPIVKPPDYGNTKFMRLPDMVSLRPPRYYACAQDWQRVVNYNDVHDGRLPEHKAWPSVQDEQRGFPAHVGPRSDLHPKLYRGPRTDEEVEQVGKQIRGLVRKEKLMPQYVRPTVNQATWTQWQARPYEQLERPADRNPVWMKSYQHAIHKRFPNHEYKMPAFPHLGPISRTTTLVNPYNPWNLRFPSLSCKLTDKVPWDKPLYKFQF